MKIKKTSFPKSFEKPMITVDIVVGTIEDGILKVLLIQRKFPPFKEKWALPGGFLRRGEDIVAAAARELKEETGVHGVYLEQLYTFGSPKRDPRGRIITVGYFALVPPKMLKLKAGYDAADAKLFPLGGLPALAFDHKEITSYALSRIRNKIQYTNVAWSLLPSAFTLGDIQRVYETIWGRRIDKRNFRKKILSLGLLAPLSKIRKGLRQRPAKLYAFRTKQYVELKRFF